MNTLSNQPYKGTTDYIGIELKKRQYIYDTWRKVCLSFGFEEYLTPLLELAEIYEAKSGEDVGKKELYVTTDLADRRLAIRPEMTPSVTRLVTKIYQSVPKPIKLFSIANFMRNERPQRGRNREFWQLNVDIFGEDGYTGDLQILKIATSIMKAFNAPTNSYRLFLNDRRIINQILMDEIGITPDRVTAAVRIMDKFDKLGRGEFKLRISELGLNKDQVNKVILYLESSSDDLKIAFPTIVDNPGFQSVSKLMDVLGDTAVFKSNLIRGFDYYDGLVFEVFDTSPANNRSMFGGGRYNGLANLFGKQNISAVGFAPGDETTKLFLETNKLFPEEVLVAPKTIYLPLIDESLIKESYTIAATLQSEGVNVAIGSSIESVGEAVTTANKLGCTATILFGSQEKNSGQITIKDMSSGTQESLSLTQLINKLTN